MRTVKNIIKVIGMLAVIAMSFSGCIKYYRLSKTEFPQGDKREDKREQVSEDIQSVAMYDQFSTKGFFDVMWLTPNVRRAYVDSYCNRRGIVGKEREAFAAEYEGKFEGKAIFCVLADVRERDHNLLTEKDPEWTMHLEFEKDKRVTPSKIIKLELDPEVKKMFGHHYSHFKKSYQVEFDISQNSLFADSLEKRTFNFIVSSVDKYSKLSWNGIGPKLKKVKGSNEDFYWL